MPEEAFVRFVDKMGPELLFCIGILVILAYVVIKAIPIFKDISLKKIETKNELDKERLEFDRQREANSVEAVKKEDERDRARTEVIATQNEIITNLVRSNEAMTIQLSSLNSSLLDSKDRSRSLGETVQDTNKKVTDASLRIFEMYDIMKKEA